ncbi:MAG: helix-turn-helix domain-containing protein [Burkholderiales bacterium]|nr:helix-turn-helix domain-containing protein [Burkholderiales bacterium]
MQYLTNWRMQCGARLLRETHANVASVALEVGYDSGAAFARAFKRATAQPTRRMCRIVQRMSRPGSAPAEISARNNGRARRNSRPAMIAAAPVTSATDLPTARSSWNQRSVSTAVTKGAKPIPIRLTTRR